MPFPRLTWAGLLIATLGWGFLLSYPLLAPHGVSTPAAPDLRDPARFILIFGENAIITGFALALLGALEKVLVLLSRLSGGTTTVRPSTRSNNFLGQFQQIPQMQQPQGMPPQQMMPQAQQQMMPQAQPQLVLQRSPNEVITRGALNGRDYVLFRDGSVLVETLLGPRRFPSIAEAQEFIGTN